MQIKEISVKRHRSRGRGNDTFEARATVAEEDDPDGAMDELYDYLALCEQRQLKRDQASWQKQDVPGSMFAGVTPT